jgi:ArsR family transcriptional regulator, arsenate/arsenite/antimonite-responsive transcriptional repressor
MDVDTAALYLSQMGNVTRLKIIRLLVRAGDKGLAVGDIQRKLTIPGSTLSHHLSHLRHAGLIHQEREATVLRCCVHYDKIQDIVEFLTEECCTDPELQMEIREKELA